MFSHIDWFTSSCSCRGTDLQIFGASTHCCGVQFVVIHSGQQLLCNKQMKLDVSDAHNLVSISCDVLETMRLIATLHRQ